MFLRQSSDREKESEIRDSSELSNLRRVFRKSSGFILFERANQKFTEELCSRLNGANQKDGEIDQRFKTIELLTLRVLRGKRLRN